MDYDGRAVREARRARLCRAVTARYGWNALGGDMFELRRMGIESSDTLFTLRAKLNGALDLLAIAKRAPAAVRRVLNRALGA